MDNVVFKRTASIERQDVNEDDRTVSLSFSSEEPINDFFDEAPRVLLHTEEAVDLSRLDQIGSLLLNHDPGQIAGAILSTRVDEADRKARAIVRFDDTELGEQTFRQVKSGSLRGVSVAAKGITARTLEEGESQSIQGREFSGPLTVVDRWQAVEISLTPVPADAGVGVNRSIGAQETMALPAEFRETLIARGLPEGSTDKEALEFVRTMRVEQQDDNKDTSDPVPANDPSAIELAIERALDRVIGKPEDKGPSAVDAVSAERERVTSLRAIGEKSGMPDYEIDRLIADGTDLSVAREMALEFLSARTKPLRHPGNVEVNLSAREKHYEAMENHLTRRCYLNYFRGSENFTYDEKKCDDVPRDLPMIEVARQMLVRAGDRQASNLDKNQIIIRSFQHATADFANLLENIATKSLGVGYNEASTTYQFWTGTGSLPDFKTASRVAVGDTDSFEVVQELMPISEATMTDKKEERSLLTYAKSFGVSRQAMINDDLGELSQTPARLGAAARRTINEQAYALLSTDRPTMNEDSTVLFSASHPSGTNIDGAAAPSKTTITTAFQQMRAQLNVGLKGKLNIAPSFIIVPLNYETEARDIIEGTYNPTTAATAIQPRISGLTIVVEPLLDDSSTTNYFFAASPNTIDTLRVEFLNGQETPSIARIDGTDILGVKWVAWIDFVAKVFDHRGLALNGT